MFPAVSFLTIAPVLYVGVVGDTFARLLLGGFFLGIAGTAFAVGVPFVNAWFPPGRRGLALGLFGIGMGGTAISAFTTVRLADAYGRQTPFLIVAAVLALYGVLALVFVRDAAYDLTPADAATRTAGFVILAVVMRPVGGWLS